MARTITDIAKRVGVSHQVVSKVINGGRSTVGASAETRRRILEAAEEMGYRPDAAGRALRRGSLDSVGVLMGGWESFHLPQRLMGAFSSTLAENNHTCTLVCTEAFDVEHISALPILCNRMVDALMISYAHGTPPALVERVHQMRVPAIWLNELFDHDAVMADEGGAADQLVRHLAEQGHRRIEFIDYSAGDPSVPYIADRIRGFATAAEELGIEALQHTHRAMPRDQRFDAARRWLQRDNHPTAVVTNSLSAAQALLCTALHLGIRVPQDLAIASFDNGENYTTTVPTITCAIRPDIEIGRAAAEMALQRASKPNDELPSRRLPFTLKCGGSTVPELHPANA